MEKSWLFLRDKSNKPFLADSYSGICFFAQPSVYEAQQFDIEVHVDLNFHSPSSLTRVVS